MTLNYETCLCHCEPRNKCGVNSTKQSHFRLHSKGIATAYGLAMTELSSVS